MAHSKIFFFAGEAATRSCTVRKTFSYSRGTDTNIVGRASTNASATVRASAT